MKKGKRYFIGIMLVLVLSLTPGCWNLTEVSDTAVPVGLGLDLENDRPQFSMQLANPVSGGETGGKSEQVSTIIESGRTFSEAARKMMLTLPRLPLWANATTIIIGPRLANQDLALCMDFLSRNRNIRKNAILFVSPEASAADCMQAKVELEPYSLVALEKMIRIQDQQLGLYKRALLGDFEEWLDTPGIEPAVPQIIVLTEKDKKKLRLSGLAVFKGRKMVGSLDEVESRGYRYLDPAGVSGGLIIISLPYQAEKMVTLELTRSAVRIKPVLDRNNITMKIEVTAEGNFYEQNFTGQMLTRTMIAQMEGLANQEIKKQITAAISKAQQLESDIFGWGREVHRIHPAFWEQIQSDWPLMFPEVQTDIKVDFKIRRTYLLHKSFDFQY